MEQELNTVEKCPLCGSEKQKDFLESKDHSYSKQSFNIVECGSCGFRYTNPIPTEETIGKYYQSDIYISHNDSKTGLMNKAYQWVRKRAMNSKEELASRYTNEKTLLDFGCGTGDFLVHCKEKGWSIKGMEPDDGARAKCLEKGLDVEHISSLQTGLKERFNIITMWHVLEHVYHLQRDFEKLSKLLKENGHMIIAVPNHVSYDAKKYGTYWAAYDLPIHLYHFQPQHIKGLAEQHGLELKEMIPMKWDAYYVSMLSQQFMGKNKWLGLKNGWMSNMKAKNGEYSSQIYVLAKKK